MSLHRHDKNSLTFKRILEPHERLSHLKQSKLSKQEFVGRKTMLVRVCLIGTNSENGRLG